MKTLLPVLGLAIAIQCFGQNGLNLDFETLERGRPAAWIDFGSKSYTLDIDSTEAQSGHLSVSIQFDGNRPDFRAWSNSVDANYAGATIKLSGYIKTENVTEGWAGLWLRIDPNAGFDNMQKQGITGTSDWALYSIEMPLDPAKAKKIVFGGLLVGKGKMWLDNLSLTIDGKPIDQAPLKPLLPAEQDTACHAGSGVVFPPLDDRRINDLALLGKV